MAAPKKVEFVITARDRSAAAFRGIRDRIKRLTRRLGGLRSALVGALTGGFLARGVARTAEKIDNIAKAAKRLGVGVGFLSRFAFSAELAGSNVGQLETGIKNLNRATAEAETTKEYADGFAAIGLEAKDLLALDPATRFLAVAKQIGAMGNDAQQTAAAMRLFGRSGSDLIPLMENLATDFDATANAADDAGAVVGDELAKKAEKFTDDLVKLNAQVEQLHRQLLALANDNDLVEALGNILKVVGALSTAVVETGAFAGRTTGAAVTGAQGLAESARNAVDRGLGRDETYVDVLERIARSSEETATRVDAGIIR